MIYLTQKDITIAYNKVKAMAKKDFENKKFSKCLNNIETAACIANNFNIIYSDYELESLLDDIGTSQISNNTSYIKSDDERFVFYDAFGWDYRGLTMQYIRALMSWGSEFLFIFENKDDKHAKAIIEELNSYQKVVSYEVQSRKNEIEKATEIYDVIKKYAPHKILMHLAPWSVAAITAFYALRMYPIEFYNINLTDHAFWLGAGCIDYNIEFRDYGCTVSIQKRGLKEKQLLLQQYYPVSKHSEFQGFPFEIKHDKTIILSGGGNYKICGGDGVYFDILERILSDNPSVIVIYAGGGNMFHLQNFIDSKNYNDRIFLLGHRSDINEVIENCDIYLATYPFGGGLMSQYALLHGKPLLVYNSDDYKTNDIEGLLYNADVQITFFDLEQLIVHAKKLIDDLDYRKKIGSEYSKYLISQDVFSNNFKEKLENKQNDFPFKYININYIAHTNLYIEIENNYLPSFQSILLKRYMLLAFILFPKIMLKFFIDISLSRNNILRKKISASCARFLLTLKR